MVLKTTCLNHQKYLLFGFVLLLAACVPEAPHDNPFDPAITSSQPGYVFQGVVYSFYQPYHPLPGIQVRLPGPGRSVLTDSSGRFKFEGLKSGSYLVLLNRENFSKDTVNIFISNKEKTFSKNFFLDALPQVKRMHYYCERKNSLFTGVVYDAFLCVILEDADGPADIDSVQLDIAKEGVKLIAAQTARIDSFVFEISQDDLPSGSIYSLNQNGAQVSIKDNAGFKSKNGPYYLSRIIAEEPQTSAPKDLEKVVQPVVFSWVAQNLPFNFSYEIGLYRQEGGLQIPVYHQKKISSQKTTLNYNGQLSAGIYSWTIAVRDDLNNYSRSFEAVFQVE